MAARRRTSLPRKESRLAKGSAVPAWLGDFTSWQIAQALLIIAASLCVFWPAVYGGWIGDDAWYISENPLMNDPARLWKAWFQPGSWIEYYPLEETVQWVQWQLWHNDTFGYHLTNLLLHIASALLVWRLFAKLRLPLAWLGGLIFVVHPMTVDSVATINELKASLSLPPFLLALICWVDYDETGRERSYWLALGFFIAAMLCKITMAPFPVVILLFAWWKRGRIAWSDLKASAPFFAASLALGLATVTAGKIYYAHSDTFFAGDHPEGDLLWRFALAGEVLAFYFSRCLWPATPLPDYPRWVVNPASPLPYLAWLVAGAVLVLLWMKRASWGRHALLGLGFFLIMLLPFLGLYWISYMHETWVLDHLLYIPIVGLIGLIIAALGEARSRMGTGARIAGAIVVAVIVAALAWESHGYAAMYQDEATLAAYTLRYNDQSATMHNNLGASLAKQGRLEEAVMQFQAALQIDPGAANASQNLGNALLGLGRIDDAVQQQEETVRLAPNLSQAHRALGDCLLQAGRVPEAIAQYREAVRLDSGSAWMHYNLGLVLSRNGQAADAIDEYNKALAIQPNDAEVQNSLGIALYSLGRTAEAQQHFQQALEINPGYSAARDNLARLQGTAPGN